MPFVNIILIFEFAEPSSLRPRSFGPGKAGRTGEHLAVAWAVDGAVWAVWAR